jgi:nitrate reductase gamma subunit
MKYIFLLILICGCSYNYFYPGMSQYDDKYTQEGWTLKCTELIDNKCITHQWFNEIIYDDQNQ